MMDESICLVPTNNHSFLDYSQQPLFNEGGDEEIIDTTVVKRARIKRRRKQLTIEVPNHVEASVMMIDDDTFLKSNIISCEPTQITMDIVNEKSLMGADDAELQLSPVSAIPKLTQELMFDEDSPILASGLPSSPIFSKSIDSDDEIEETIKAIDFKYESQTSTSPESHSSESSTYSQDVDFNESMNIIPSRGRNNKRVKARKSMSQSRIMEKLIEDARISAMNGVISSEETASSGDDIREGLFHEFCFIVLDYPPQEMKLIEKTIRENGGKVASIEPPKQWYSDRLFEMELKKMVLLTDAPKSSKPSYLVALMLNIPILKKEWLFDSIEKACVISENVQNYLVPRGSCTEQSNGTISIKTENQVFNPTFRMNKRENRLFSDSSVRFVSKDQKFVQSWKSILKAGGASIDEYLHNQTSNYTNFVFVKDISDVTTNRLEHFNKINLPIICRDSILNMIISDSIQNLNTLKITSLPNIEKRSADESFCVPMTPTPTPLVTPFTRKIKPRADMASIRASRWFAHVEEPFNPDASVLDIRTPISATPSGGARNKSFLPSMPQDLNQTFAASTKKSRILDPNVSFDERSSYSRLARMSTRKEKKLTTDVQTVTEEKTIVPGDYFLNEEKNQDRKTRFVRLSKLVCVKRKKSEETDKWQLETFHLGDMVKMSPLNMFEGGQFVRIDQLYYGNQSAELLGTEYKPCEEIPKKLIPTNEQVRLPLSSIQYKLFINNGTNTTVSESKGKNKRRMFYCDHAVKDFSVVKRNDPTVLDLQVLSYDQLFLNELELKREQKPLRNSVKLKTPYFIRFTSIEFNGKIIEEGSYIRLTTRDHVSLVARIKELRERDFTNILATLSRSTVDRFGFSSKATSSSSMLIEVLCRDQTSRDPLFVLTHEVEVTLSKILSLEPICAIQKDLIVHGGVDVSSLGAEIIMVQ